MRRNMAIAIPARDEAAWLPSCLDRLAGLDRDARVGRVDLVIVANNCTDDTAATARAWAAAHAAVSIEVIEATLPPARANAGWARRAALDAAADLLSAPTDLVLCTDADTLVASDWLVRTLDHVDQGYEAVAGFAYLRTDELRRLPSPHRRRLGQIRRYAFAIDRLRAEAAAEEPWPRHFYEGGASIAVTLDSYRAIGGAPTPPVSEDKALFAALAAAGRRIRHPRDVRVYTSCRLQGRAPGGAADTLAAWAVQDEAAPLWGLKPAAAYVGVGDADAILTFAGLAAETETTRRLLRQRRGGRTVVLQDAD